MASDIALELIGDFAVVCLLCPKHSFRQPPKTGLSSAIGRLPGHAFQVRPRELAQGPEKLAKGPAELQKKT